MLFALKHAGPWGCVPLTTLMCEAGNTGIELMRALDGDDAEALRKLTAAMPTPLSHSNAAAIWHACAGDRSFCASLSQVSRAMPSVRGVSALYAANAQHGDCSLSMDLRVTQCLDSQRAHTEASALKPGSKLECVECIVFHCCLSTMARSVRSFSSA